MSQSQSGFCFKIIELESYLDFLSQCQLSASFSPSVLGDNGCTESGSESVWTTLAWQSLHLLQMNSVESEAGWNDCLSFLWFLLSANWVFLFSKPFLAALLTVLLQRSRSLAAVSRLLHSLDFVLKSHLDFLSLYLIYCLDMTFAVDWALKANYLSILIYY